MSELDQSALLVVDVNHLLSRMLTLPLRLSRPSFSAGLTPCWSRYVMPRVYVPGAKRRN